MRSVTVVFPASICAMIPMFRIRSSGIERGMLMGTFYLSSPGSKVQGPKSGTTETHALSRMTLPLTLDSGPSTLDSFGLPAIVGEGLVRLGHAVQVFPSLDCRPGARGS